MPPGVPHLLSNPGALEALTYVPDDLPSILADPDKFAQVMTNLVENAVRHGAGGLRADDPGGREAPGKDRA